MLDLFDDPNVKRKEAKIVIARIMKSLNTLANKLLVIALLQETKYANLVMPSFDKRITLSSAGHSRLEVGLYNGKSKANVTLSERDLKIVRRN